ncbi:Fic family protein [Candidatus Microgenomates bacterium]|nr:Fic family protein [Candidatus Microgenomates bacterium]
MYAPKYTINNAILKNIGTIEACREVIDNAPLVPAYEKKFKDEAALRTVYHGTHLEGNDLSFSQAQRILEGEEISARDRDIQEIINYRNVVNFLDGIVKPLTYSVDLLCRLHELTTDKLLTADKVGQIRTSQVVIKDGATGEITFRPPPAIEVPFLLADFFDWLNSSMGREVHPILRGGIAHYALVAIHPFVEGNGRVSRAFATLILYAEGYDTKRLFSLEEYFDRDAASYYDTLINTSSQSEELAGRDLTEWLSYFTKGLAIELERVRDQIRRISADLQIKKRMGQQVALSDRQLKLMEYLNQHSRIQMREAKKLLPMVSEDTILREFQDLFKKGIIKRESFGRGAVYKLRT